MPKPMRVSIYRGDESLRLVVPNRALLLPRPSRARARIGGAGCTLLANLVLAAFLVVGTRLPDMPWTSAGQRNTDPVPAMTVDLLLPSEASAPAAPVLTVDEPRITWTVPPSADLAIAAPQLAMMEEVPQSNEPAPDAPEEAKLVSEPERLRGIYAGQIEGRIDRAWERDDDWMKGVLSRRCSARVEQNAEGQVQQVEFLDCPQLPDWKRNLESAIRQASPLPAPPERAVFASVIYLDIDDALHVRMSEAGKPTD